MENENGPVTLPVENIFLVKLIKIHRLMVNKKNVVGFGTIIKPISCQLERYHAYYYLESDSMMGQSGGDVHSGE